MALYIGIKNLIGKGAAWLRSKWTTIVTQLKAAFRYRVAGGSDNALLPERNGRAVIDTIYGNTVKWNQLLASGRLVDMGLPSGTLWATSNIDITQEDGFAASPFQYGCTMFSWGNVEGHNTPASGTTFEYDWGSINSAEPWYDGQPYGSTPGAALVSDILANDVQDAARKNVGSLFKMPSTTQFQELIDNCIFIDANGDEIPSATVDKRVTVNGVLGIYLKSNANGNRLFFPASGYGSGSSLSNSGVNGYYWSTLFQSTRYARFLSFSSGGVYPQNYNVRHFGYAVRPIVAPSITSEVGHDNHKFCLTSNHKNMVDLTALEYPDIANTTPSVAEVESWLALNVGQQDYYPYDEGSLISFTGSALKSVGWNKWNSTFSLEGYYLNDVGGEQSNGLWSITNYISVLPSTQYCMNKTRSSNAAICFYNSNKEFIGSAKLNSVIVGTNSIFTTPANAAFIRVSIHSDWENVCVNLSDPAKNGTYEPYKEDILNLDVTKIYGKVNGEGSYVQCYLDGMKSAGSVHDSLTVNNAVKVMKRVDLGSLKYTYSSYGTGDARNYFYTRITDRKHYGQGITSNNYKCITTSVDPIDLLNEQYVFNDYATSFGVNIKDSNITPSDVVNNHIAKLEGVMLDYELATPINYTDLIYSEDGGVTGTPLTEFKYKVDKYSTEELLVPASVAGEPTSTALVADIEYQKK